MGFWGRWGSVFNFRGGHPAYLQAPAGSFRKVLLSHISAVMGWCYNNGLLAENAARGVKVDEGKGFKEPTRTAFSQDDLARIFGTEMFVDPGAYGSKQWSMLIALYTGARSSSEIRRMKLDDIYREQGVLVFDLIEATKNTHSKRLVPVHQVLLDLGIEAYVERLRKAGKTTLFWDWEPDDKINRWFLRTYKAEVGITDTFDERRLARSVVAEQGNDLPRGDVEAHIVDSRETAEPLDPMGEWKAPVGSRPPPEPASTQIQVARLIDEYGEDHHHADQDELPEGWNVEHYEPRGQHSDNERADQRAQGDRRRSEVG